MLALIFYGIRSFLRRIGNSLRKISKAPDYIIFTLQGDYPEIPQVVGNPFLRYFRPPKISLLEITEQMRLVAKDPRVKGVILHLRPLQMPLSKISMLRGLIKELQKAGKIVVTWSYMYDTSMYYLATAADRIILLPGGLFGPVGLYQPYQFLGEALAKIGLQADFIQITPYKSATDMFTRRTMSDEAREMANWISDSIYDEILEAIAEGRKVDKDTAKTIVDQTPCIDLDALRSGAVDDLLAMDDLPQALGDEDQPAQLSPWESAQKRLLQLPIKIPGRYIALMGIEGMIIDGHSGQPPIEPPVPIPVVMDTRAGDMSVVQTIRQISEDRRAVGVLVYVDSRGGSATASESIRIALEKLASKKPLIVIMGPVAASGGYWVSSPGKLIFAQPSTITGSIGVLAGKIVNKGVLEKLFVHQEVIQRGEHRNIFEPESGFSNQERVIIEGYVQRIYDLFLEKVSKSRGMEPSQVNEIGGGRVWTGRQARDKGLVDQFGGINQAIDTMKEMLNLSELTPVRLYSPGKQSLPPNSQPASLLKYGFDGLRIVNGHALCLCPWVEIQDQGGIF